MEVVFICAGVLFILCFGFLLGWSRAEDAAYERDQRLVALKRQVEAQMRALQTMHEIHDLFWQARRGMQLEHQGWQRPQGQQPLVVQSQVVIDDERDGPWHD